MNILYVVHGFPPSVGPAAINAYKIVEYLAKFGHKILVLSPAVFSKTSTFKNLDILSKFDINVKYSSSLIKIPLNLIFSHFENMIKYLIKSKSDFKPDLILSQYQAYHYASVVGEYLSSFFKIPHIIRSHDIFFVTSNQSYPFQIFHSIIYPRIYRSILKSNIFYVVCSELRNYMLKMKKLRNLDLRIHHNGIDNTLFYPSKNQDELKNKFGCENIISYIGILSHDAGLHHFMHILPQLFNTHKDTHLIILGDGPYKNYILKFLKNNKLENRVHFYGIVPHDTIPYYINNSDIGIGRITPSTVWRYSVPIKCLEYLACKKTFISTPISKDLVKNDDVGLLLRKNFTKEEIIEKTSILIEDKGLRSRLGENGLKKINEVFLWDNLMNNFNKDIQLTMKDV